MKRLSFFLAFVLVLSLGSAFAQECSMSIETYSGLYGDSLWAGKTHVVEFRMTELCNDTSTYNIGNAFEVWSPDGATVLGIQGSTNQVWADMGWTQSFVNHYVAPAPGDVADPTTYAPAAPIAGPVDGPNAVAVYFTGTTFSLGNGLVGPFDDVPYQIEFTTQAADEGLMVCIDSTFTPPGGTWKWAALNGPTEYPTWYSEPLCREIYVVPNLPPEICDGNTDGNYDFSHCGVGTIDFSVGAYVSDDPAAPQDGCDIVVGEAYDPECDAFHYEIMDGPGAIDANTGVWTWNNATPGVYVLDVAAIDPAPGSDTYSTHAIINVTVTNEAPTITCPGTALIAPVGVPKTQSVVTSDDCDPIVVSIIDDDGVLGTINVVGNDVTYTPDLADVGDVCFTIEASDGVDAATCDMCWTVIAGAPYSVTIEKDEGSTGIGAIQGQFTEVTVTLNDVDVNEGIGGFDFLFAYDQTALNFSEAVEGAIYDDCGWEYFTFRYGPDGNCGSGCPSGMVRVIGIAETNNGPYHPTCDVDTVPVDLFDLVFLVTNDRTFECQYAPVRFYWMDCGDNTISNEDGSLLYVNASIFEFENDINIADTAHGFPGYLGVPNSCLDQPLLGKPAPERAVDFRNGGVDIVCADSIDARGDINLNDIAYEIADAVMLTNYFISGLGAFGTHIDGSVAASDVNADGITLSVADLVYLIRVVVGDAPPYDKVSPVHANVVTDGGVVSVDQAIGGAHVIYEGVVTPENIAGVDMEFGIVDGNTHVIMTSETTSFEGAFVRADAKVLDVDMATYYGNPIVAKHVPGSFSLAQNYPNPFNPSTTIAFAIPGGGNFDITFYNVTGQVVNRISGSTDSGFGEVEWDASELASGVYFYKLQSENGYTATKKAVLLK